MKISKKELIVLLENNELTKRDISKILDISIPTLNKIIKELKLKYNKKTGRNKSIKIVD